MDFLSEKQKNPAVIYTTGFCKMPLAYITAFKQFTTADSLSLTILTGRL